jgi:hypothetical protein
MAIERSFNVTTVVQNILIFIDLMIFIFLIQPAGWIFMVYVVATLFSLIAIFLHWYNNIAFDRVMLSLYLYLITKSILSMKYDLLHTHFIFPMLVAVGLYSTFFTQAGFIGVVGVDKKAVRKSSLVLLAIVLFVWLNAYALRWPGQIAMFAVVGWAYGVLGRRVLSAQLNRSQSVRPE